MPARFCSTARRSRNSAQPNARSVWHSSPAMKSSLEAVTVAEVVAIGRFPAPPLVGVETRGPPTQRAVADALERGRDGRVRRAALFDAQRGRTPTRLDRDGAGARDPDTACSTSRRVTSTSASRTRFSHCCAALPRKARRSSVRCTISTKRPHMPTASRLLGDETLLALAAPESTRAARCSNAFTAIEMERVRLPGGRLRVFARRPSANDDSGGAAARRSRDPARSSALRTAGDHHADRVVGRCEDRRLDVRRERTR